MALMMFKIPTTSHLSPHSNTWKSVKFPLCCYEIPFQPMDFHQVPAKSLLTSRWIASTQPVTPVDLHLGFHSGPMKPPFKILEHSHFFSWQDLIESQSIPPYSGQFFFSSRSSPSNPWLRSPRWPLAEHHLWWARPLELENDPTTSWPPRGCSPGHMAYLWHMNLIWCIYGWFAYCLSMKNW